jgi:hypothetical protein
LYLTEEEWDMRRKKQEAVVQAKVVGAAALHQVGHRASPPTTSVSTTVRWSIGRVSAA